jgi:RNA polymerase sigma-B factor
MPVLNRPESDAAPPANGFSLKAGYHRKFDEGAEAELLRRYAQTRDPALKQELVRRLLPLARSLALRYRGSPEPLDDLIQVASLGLVKALDGFDPDRGTTFPAYAAPTILGELRRHFRDHVWQLHLPRRLQERTMAVQEAASQLSDELGRSPTEGQIAQCLELSAEEVSEALQADEARRTVSLDVPANHEDPESPMVESVGWPEGGYDAVETRLAAEGADLDDQERRVLHLRFEKGLTQDQIGSLLGISQMQVSRIMRGALRKLLAAVQDA